MGYVALVLGYLYRFSIWFRIIAVACAVALGYLFNLIRLCTLVLYYWVALRFHSMQGHAAGADYVIGSLFFLIATSLFVLLIQRKGRSSGGWAVSKAWAADSENGGDPRDKTLRWKWLVSFALLVPGSIPLHLWIRCAACIPVRRP